VKCRTLLLLLALGAPLAQGASRLDFGVWMRAIDNRSVSVQQHLRAGRHDAALADARALEQLYADMARYFEQDYPAADAVAISRDGQAQASTIARALAATDLTGAQQAARAIALACNDCHDPYKPFP
jgi:hypothetical protein